MIERLKRSYVFWSLLVAAVVLPATLSAWPGGKRLFWTNIADSAGAGKGSATIMDRSGSFTYMAHTFGLPGSVVTQVWLEPRDGSWQIPLCTNGGPPEDDCTYDSTGNLYIDGPLSAPLFIAAGVSGADFNTALTNGDLGFWVYYGDTAGGYFIRII